MYIHVNSYSSSVHNATCRLRQHHFLWDKAVQSITATVQSNSVYALANLSQLQHES